MKKLKNKIFLCLALSAMIIPTINVFAEEENPTPSESPTPTITPSPTTTPDDPNPPVSPTDAPTLVAELQDLSIEGATLSPAFSKNQTTYTAVVAANVESVQVKASAANGMTVNGTGTRYLKEGANVIEVTVVAGTSGSKTYKVTVTRATSDLTLKSLRIQGQSLNEAFEPNVLNYTADIPYNMDSIIIQAGASNSAATFQVLGNTDLKVGKNTVRIIVKNAVGDTQEYRIIVTRLEENDSQNDEDDDNNSIETSISTTTSRIMENSARPDKGSTLKYILVVVFCLILLVIAGIGIYFYIRTGDNTKRKQKKLEKLKKKQEKLNQEITEQDDSLENEEIEESLINNQETIEEIDSEVELNETDFDEETKEITIEETHEKRSDKNVLEDFDDLFLDE